MAKTEITKQLEKDIYNITSKQGTFGCFEVTIGFFGKERVDYMTYNSKGEWRCYEIKSSVSDFHSEAKKSFVGHYNYYVLTNELYELIKKEIPSDIGVYASGRLIKKPKKRSLAISEEVLKDSLIRSLYRDARKVQRNQDEDYVGRLKNHISYIEGQLREERNTRTILEIKLHEKHELT